MKSALVGGVVVIAVAAAVFWFLRGGDGDVAAINERLDQLEALCSKRGKESPIASAAQARKVSLFFVQRPDVNVPRLGRHTGQDAIAGAITGLRTMVQTAEVRFGARQIDVDAETGRAVAGVTATVEARTRAGTDERYQDRFRIEWEKVEGVWFIRRVVLSE